MSTRSKIVAAALGLFLAAGAIADVSAQTTTQPAKPVTTHTLASKAKPASHKIAGTHHRFHVAHHKAKHTTVAQTCGKHAKIAHRTIKSLKTAHKLAKSRVVSHIGKSHLQKNAMNRTKATVVR